MRVEFNKKLNKLLGKIDMQKVKTYGLTAIGASIPLTMALVVANNARQEKFEYDNNSNQTLSEAYEEYTDVEIDGKIKKILDTFADYENAADNYEEISSTEDVDVATESRARRNLVSTAPSLVNGSKEVIRLQLIESLGLSSNTTMDIRSSYDSTDGVNHLITLKDGDNVITIDGSKLPIEYRELLDTLYEESRYQGDGSGTKWKDQIDSYMDELEDAYYQTLSIATEDAPHVRGRK